jgi:hypothetical protein
MVFVQVFGGFMIVVIMIWLVFMNARGIVFQNFVDEGFL